ncbi:MAG: radical SAM family heme chaperone HemW [Burkholderiales bacterium]|nr:radical SAM family heme chaperone HemW [Bacteroidia bacterium]
MSGIYIHIPFCKKACAYCDFHFSTSLQQKESLVKSILSEIDLRHHYLNDRKIDTIYFGGGTPSLLSEKETFLILEKIYKTYIVSNDAEITLECNPDDLSNEKLKELKRLEINRLSIGLQSFDDDELIWMNRAHTAKESEASVKRAQDRGFENITIDLIYGSKFSNLANWKKTLDKAIGLNVKHISSYNLTIEEKTKLGHDFKIKKEVAIDDEKSAELFLEMIDRLEKNNFIHYEISNFGKEGYFSIHNSNYWKGKHYIGFGPSAHSFDGVSRQWNVSNNSLYIKQVSEKTEAYFEKEILTEKERFNEYVLTSMRTIWGLDLNYLKTNFNSDFVKSFLNQVDTYIKLESVLRKNNIYTLTEKGKLLADKIASELFV